LKRYTQKEHKIKLKDIDPDALTVLNTLQQRGFNAYLVGGSVRDLLLNYTPKDFDISTNALPEEIKKIFPNCFLVGKRFRLAHVRINHKTFEVSTFRKGDNEDASLIFSDNDWGTEEEDVLRRDFTVNGLFYDNQSETIIDYVGGVEDAKKNILRCIGNPYIRFKQDPVRMIRLLKFRARFGLNPQEEMIEALFVLKKEILKSSPIRILEEILRMLESGSSVSFLKNLQIHGFLETLLPNIADHFETPLGNEIYSYLTEVDKSILNENKRPPHRSLLVACIIFPIFNDHIKEFYLSHPKKAHIGRISQEAFNMIQDLFSPTLNITKKILGETQNILSMQFRFTPLQKQKKLVCKIPNSPDFSSALKFFKMRANLEPGLTDLFTEWSYYYDLHKKAVLKNPEATKPKRRRRYK
jgi:poly(A) polymerase